MLRERSIPKSPQSGRNTPNEGFFNSKNYTELEHIQRRAQKKLQNASSKLEERLDDEEQSRLEEEKRRKTAALERSKKESLKPRGPCDMCIKAANCATQMNEPKVCKKILRRPIAPRCTCMDPTDGQLPVLAIEQPVDIDDWAYKPFSTIVSGGAAGYRGHFPLLMQKCTEAAEKDTIQVQTETRRHSVVTTNYLTGRIKLESTGHKSVNLSVFPVLHVVLSSSEDEDELSSSDAGDDYEQEDELANLRPHAAQSTSEHEMPTPRRRSPAASNSGQQRRRSSLAPGSLPGRRPQGPGTSPRVVRRRSIDQSSLAQSFAKALEAAMTPISEEEKRAVSPGEEFDVKHAEETMIHMAQNLQTLEKFLQGGSTSSVSDVSSSDDSL